MASPKTELPKELQALVTDVGRPVSSQNVVLSRAPADQSRNTTNPNRAQGVERSAVPRP